MPATIMSASDAGSSTRCSQLSATFPARLLHSVCHATLPDYVAVGNTLGVL